MVPGDKKNNFVLNEGVGIRFIFIGQLDPVDNDGIQLFGIEFIGQDAAPVINNFKFNTRIVGLKRTEDSGYP